MCHHTVLYPIDSLRFLTCLNLHVRHLIIWQTWFHVADRFLLLVLLVLLLVLLVLLVLQLLLHVLRPMLHLLLLLRHLVLLQQLYQPRHCITLLLQLLLLRLLLLLLRQLLLLHRLLLRHLLRLLQRLHQLRYFNFKMLLLLKILLPLLLLQLPPLQLLLQLLLLLLRLRRLRRRLLRGALRLLLRHLPLLLLRFAARDIRLGRFDKKLQNLVSAELAGGDTAVVGETSYPLTVVTHIYVLGVASLQQQPPNNHVRPGTLQPERWLARTGRCPILDVNHSNVRLLRQPRKLIGKHLLILMSKVYRVAAVVRVALANTTGLQDALENVAYRQQRLLIGIAVADLVHVIGFARHHIQLHPWISPDLFRVRRKRPRRSIDNHVVCTSVHVGSATAALRAFIHEVERAIAVRRLHGSRQSSTIKACSKHNVLRTIPNRIQCFHTRTRVYEVTE
jgi:hypothetical protein